MIHLRPITNKPEPHRNIYEDWLQTLTEHQFHEHVAGRLHGPEVGARRPSALSRMLTWGTIILGAAIIYIGCFR